jgi:hypothetical protein
MPVLRRPVEPAGADRKYPAPGQSDAIDPIRTSVLGAFRTQKPQTSEGLQLLKKEIKSVFRDDGGYFGMTVPVTTLRPETSLKMN